MLRLPFALTPDCTMTFDDLYHDFTSFGVLVGPSEAHGMFCGRLVMGEVLSDANLLLAAAEFWDTEAFDEIANLVKELYQFCTGQIQQTGFEFQIMLPAEDTSLGERTESLAEWCQGFLYGLGQAGLDEKTILSEDAVEILSDLAAISQLRIEDADTDDEMNFFELVEFVRVVVLLLHGELNQTNAGPNPTLH